MNNLKKAIAVLRNEGFFRLLKKGIRHIYDNSVVPVLPRTSASYNGVEVNAARYFDSVVPWRHKDRPQYESGLVTATDQYVLEGDDVVIVGGGWGVTAVKAAQKVGASGSVHVYEGSGTEVDNIIHTIKMNGVSDRVSVEHSIVGPKISLRGEAESASRVSPEQLPECDVLELDCEGSETEILKRLTIKPRVILVESHGKFDAPSSKLNNYLNKLEYTVESKTVAIKNREEFCEEYDIHVLAAVLE